MQTARIRLGLNCSLPCQLWKSNNPDWDGIHFLSQGDNLLAQAKHCTFANAMLQTIQRLERLG
jgi:hypothetical protein